FMSTKWIPALLITNLALVLGFGYVSNSATDAIGDRISALETSAQQAQAENEKKLVNLSSDIDLINKRVGVTATELTQARSAAQALKVQQERSAKQLATELAAKANTADVDTLRQEATS